MKNLRKYGKAPFNIVTIHGGPGAPGEMAPVARELSNSFSVLEPMQTKINIKGQLLELKNIIKIEGELPVYLIGYSWGAMLSFIFTAQNPKIVKKLILISSAVFEEKYSAEIMQKRMERLSKRNKQNAESLLNTLSGLTLKNKNIAFSKLEELFFKSDSYNPIPHKNEILRFQYYIYKSIWNEAKVLRKKGRLLELGKEIKCPVVAIHGDYDPHPFEGVKEPLSNLLNDFKFILLKNCGHHPWYEKQAKKDFYDLLLKELL